METLTMEQSKISWHAKHSNETKLSATTALSMLFEALGVQSVLDVGCGDGRWLSVALELGAPKIKGVDGTWVSPTERLIPSAFFEEKDLSKYFDLGEEYGISICLEVAEHLNAAVAQTLVGNLIRHSDCILFGAAIPNHNGYKYVNEQWQSYWADLFADQGYRPIDLFRHALWDRAGVHTWCKQNMLLYIREKRRDLLLNVQEYIDYNNIQQIPLNVVHPDRYGPVTSDDQKTLSPFMGQLSGEVRTKISNLEMFRIRKRRI